MIHYGNAAYVVCNLSDTRHRALCVMCQPNYTRQTFGTWHKGLCHVPRWNIYGTQPFVPCARSKTHDTQRLAVSYSGWRQLCAMCWWHTAQLPLCLCAVCHTQHTAQFFFCTVCFILMPCVIFAHTAHQSFAIKNLRMDNCSLEYREKTCSVQERRIYWL